MSDANRTSRRKTQWGSTTTIIASLLVTSAIIRLSGGTAAAIALEVDNLMERAPAYPQPDIGQGSTQIDEILLDLERRKAVLLKQESEMERRRIALEELKKDAETRMEQLVEAQQELEGTMSVARTAAEKDVSQLVSVYESMKPKDAAKVFQKMPPKFAAGFLARMQPETAANIVASLEPESAYSISVVLAGRNIETSQP